MLIKYESIKSKSNVIILEDVNIKLEKSINVIKGYNGIGKTTLVNQIFKDYKSTTSYLKQELVYFDNLKVSELYKIYKLKSKDKRLTKNLSGGQLRLIQIDICIKCSSSLIILDEPFNHLDKQMISVVKNEILKIKNKYIIVIDHYNIFESESEILLNEFSV